MKSLRTDTVTALSIVAGSCLLLILEGLGTTDLLKMNIWLMCGVVIPLCTIVLQTGIRIALSRKYGSAKPDRVPWHPALVAGYFMLPVFFFAVGMAGVLTHDYFQIISGLILLAFFIGNDLGGLKLFST